MAFSPSVFKRSSAAYIRFSRPRPLLQAVFFLGLTVLLGFFSSDLLLGQLDFPSISSYMSQYYEYFAAGDIESAFLVYDRAIGMIASHLASLPQGVWFLVAALTLIPPVLEGGMQLFMLNTVHSAPASHLNLLDGFAPKLIGVKLLCFLVRTLGYLLFLVPGVIFSYMYHQAYYYQYEHPEMMPWECMRESRIAMKGHKRELFLLDLSFLFWIICSSTRLFGYFAYAASVWALPYRNLAYALFYDALFHPGTEHKIEIRIPKRPGDDSE